jgi:hypothetical protein
MKGDWQNSDVLDLYRTYEAPPEGFDPRAASRKELVHHGLPRRPTSEEQRLDRIWQRRFARPANFVQAELRIDPVMSERDPLRRKGPEFRPSGWGGAVVETAQVHPNDPVATMAFAQWVIPEVVHFEPFVGAITAGFWVGLDGFRNSQVLQAGVAVTVGPDYWFTPYAPVRWWAWTEWFTEEFQDPAVEISNFDVAAGNTIACLVCAEQPDFGHITMLNVSTGQATSVGINARPGITSQGESVEWIVEGVSVDLPAFYPITFTECVAATQSELFDLSSTFEVTEIEGNGGRDLTQTQVALPQSAVVSWEGWA